MRFGDFLTPTGIPEKIIDPASERFVTVRLRGQGAEERAIGAGKTPRPFTGYRVSAGDFIYSRIDARNGAFAIIPNSLNGAVVSKDFPTYRIDATLIDPDYLMHYCRSGLLAAVVRTKSNGATNRQRIPEDVFLDIDVPLPLLEEQRRIARILSTSSKAIEESEKTLLRLRELQENLFQSSIIEKSAASMPLGEISLRKPDYGLNVSSVDFDSDLGRYVRITDISDSGNLIEKAVSPEPSANKLKRDKKLVPNDLLFARTGATVGKTYLHSEDSKETTWFAGYLVRFKINPEIIDPKIVFDFAHTARYWSWVERRQQTVAQPNIGASTYAGELMVPIPSKSSSEEYLVHRNRIQKLIQATRTKISRLQELHRSFATRAFAGEL